MIKPTNIRCLAREVDGSVLYFSYGANLSQSTLDRRGITPSSRMPCVLKDDSLGIAFGHRGGYATLISRPSERKASIEVLWHQGDGQNVPHIYWQPHGVLYSLSREQFKALKSFEVGYCEREVEVVPYSSFGGDCTGNGSSIVAMAFVSSWALLLRRPVVPVARYRDLILEGAEHHGLDSEYLEWLKFLPAVPSSAMGTADYRNTPSETAAKAIAMLMAIGASMLAVTNFK